MTAPFRLTAPEIAFYIAERRRGAVVFTTQAVGWAAIAFANQAGAGTERAFALHVFAAGVMLAGLLWSLAPKRWMEIARLRRAAPLANWFRFVQVYPVLSLAPLVVIMLILAIVALEVRAQAAFVSPYAPTFAAAAGWAIGAIAALLQLNRLERDAAAA